MDTGRQLATAALVAATLGLMAAAPERDFRGEAESWRERTERTIEEVLGVGADATPYKARWGRANLLLQRGMHQESLGAFRSLAADLEGWDPSPEPPRRPAEALLDAQPGPGTRDPRAAQGRVLGGPAGVGRYQPMGLAQEVADSHAASYRRPLSGDRTMTLGHKIDHEALKERTRAAQTAAARRWQDLAEEADRPEGGGTGRLEPRLGGGQVLALERPARSGRDGEVAARRAVPEGGAGVGRYRGARAGPGDTPAARAALPEGLGVGGYRRLGAEAVVADAEAVPPLAGPDGVGSYGSPLRLARAGVFPGETPAYTRPAQGWSGSEKGPDPSPALLAPRPAPPPTVVARVPEPVERVGPTVEDLGGDDLGGDELGGDELDDLGLGDDDPMATAAGPPVTVTVTDLGLRRGELANKVVRVEGTLGVRAREMRPHVRKLAHLEAMGNRLLFSLDDGAVQVDVLAETGWVEDLAPGTRVRIEGGFFVDPSPENPDDARLLIADSVAPL